MDKLVIPCILVVTIVNTKGTGRLSVEVKRETETLKYKEKIVSLNPSVKVKTD